MQQGFLNLDQGRVTMRRSPCRTCGEDTLHKGTVCIHCNTTALAIPADAKPRAKFDYLKRKRGWNQMHADRGAAARARAEASRQKFEGDAMTRPSFAPAPESAHGVREGEVSAHGVSDVAASSLSPLVRTE